MPFFLPPRQHDQYFPRQPFGDVISSINNTAIYPSAADEIFLATTITAFGILFVGVIMGPPLYRMIRQLICPESTEMNYLRSGNSPSAYMAIEIPGWYESTAEADSSYDAYDSYESSQNFAVFPR